jgi:AraC family transcriptional regulator
MNNNPAQARRENARRFHRVLEHIDAHLGQPLVLADLADVAHFSPYHFHRLFTAWMGETLGDYLRRRRLEVAALRLLTQPRTSVLSMALMVGFGSGEAFARAFKARFDCSPSQWRLIKQEEREVLMRKRGQHESNLDQAGFEGAGDHGADNPTDLENSMKVIVKNREAVRVAYLRHVGPYGGEVAQFWQQQFHPFLARHSLYGRPLYGISHDDPLITAPEKCRYDTAVEVDDSFAAPAGAHIGQIAGGTYGALAFVGTPATISAAWSALMREWLPASGYQLDGRPTFEYYPPNAAFDAATNTFECEIVIPLAPLYE